MDFSAPVNLERCRVEGQRFSEKSQEIKELLPRMREELWKNRLRLEGELGRELDTARAAATEERVADAHVAGSGDVVATIADFTRAGLVKAADAIVSACSEVRSRIGDECRQQGT